MASTNSTTATDYFTVDSLTANELDRLFSKIVADPVAGCWNWTGCTAGRGRGYGSFRFRNREMVYVHRLMYAWVFEPLPRGKSKHIPTVDHVCENTLCCNPFHMQLLCHRDNILKGRSMSARYARRTHCKKGHPLDGRNSLSRYCKTCNRASARAWKERKMAAHACSLDGSSDQSGTGAK